MLTRRAESFFFRAVTRQLLIWCRHMKFLLTCSVPKEEKKGLGDGERNNSSRVCHAGSKKWRTRKKKQKKKKKMEKKMERVAVVSLWVDRNYVSFQTDFFSI